MFFGRVDVYWPDGPIESYRLEKPSLAVGRSPGNDIVLDTTAVSRYHITLTVTDQQVTLEDLDSVNGTYVDGRRIEPRVPHAIRGGEEMQIGDIRLIYYPPVSLDEDTVAGAGDTTQRIVLAQPDYRVELDGPDMPVAPGAHVQARLKIENLGEEPDRFFVEIDGLPKGWVRLDRVELEIEPGDQAQAVLSIKPLRRSETRPGDHTFNVRVRPKSRPSETVDVPRTVRVLPFSGFGLALGDGASARGEEFKVYLHNQGNAPLPLVVQGSDPNRELQFRFSTGQMTLGPGERRTVTGRVQPRRPRWFGPERAHEFAVLARATDPSGFTASVPGQLVERAALPSWVPMLMVPGAVLVTALAIGLVLLLLGRDNDRAPVTPTIAAFRLAQPSVAVGEPVTVEWQVADADSLALQVTRSDELQQYDLDAATQSLTISFDQSGVYSVLLRAVNGEESAAASQSVEVLPQVTLSLAVLDGTELIRSVQGDVRVTWEVQGAREFDGEYSIWLESSDRAARLLDSPQAASGQAVVSVVPRGEQSEWLVTLYAEGRDGVLARVPQMLPIVFPSCDLTATRTIVRSGPGESYPALVPPLESSAEGNLSLAPTTRDPSGDWLQVTIGVENARQGWVPKEDFNCTNFDPSRLAVSTDFPPAPKAVPSTATPAPSPSPSPTRSPVPPSSAPSSATPPRATITPGPTPTGAR